MKRRIHQTKTAIGVLLLLGILVDAGPPPPPPPPRVKTSLAQAGVTTSSRLPPPPPPGKKVTTTSVVQTIEQTAAPLSVTSKPKTAEKEPPKSNDVDALLERFNRVVESKHHSHDKPADPPGAVAKKPVDNVENKRGEDPPGEVPKQSLLIDSHNQVVHKETPPKAPPPSSVVENKNQDPPSVAKKSLQELHNEQVRTPMEDTHFAVEDRFNNRGKKEVSQGVTKKSLEEVMQNAQQEPIIRKPPQRQPPPPSVDDEDDDDDELVLGDAANAHAPPTTLFHAPPQQVEHARDPRGEQQQPIQQQPIQQQPIQQQQQPPQPPQEHLQRQQRPLQRQPPQHHQQPPQRQHPGQTRPQQYQQRPPQYNQNQQQQRPPPQHHRPPPRRQGPPPGRRPPPQKKSLLQSVWGRVEKGLDSLANVEDMVTDRASQLTSQVTQQAKELLVKPSAILSSSRVTEPQQAAPPQQQQVPPGKRAFGARVSVATQTDAPTTTDATTKPNQPLPNSLASLYAMPTTVAAADSSDDDEDETINPAAPWEKVVIGKPTPIGRAGASDARPPGGGNVYGRQSSPFTQLQVNGQQQLQQQQKQQQQQPTRPRAFAAARKDPVQQQHQQSRPDLARSDSFDSISSESAWKSRLSSLVPSMPRMPSVLSKMLGRGSGSFNAMNDATMDVWKEDEKLASKFMFKRRKKETKQKKKRGSDNPESSSSTPPLTDLLARCKDGESTSLLSNRDMRQCRSIGRRKAVVDVVFLALVVFGVHQLMSTSTNFSQQYTVDSAVAAAVSILTEATQGWALYAFLAAFFTHVTNLVLFDGQIRAMKHAVANTIEGASQYCQLYMRLVSGHAVDKHVPERLQQAARAQSAELIQLSRLQNFVLLVLATMMIMTVSVVQRILFAMLASLGHVVTLPELRSWPVPWGHIGASLKEITVSLGGTIREQLGGEVSSFLENPMAMGFQLSVVAVLVVVACLPKLEHRRKVRRLEEDEEEDEDVTASAFGTVATLSNLGVSSASRLGLLSKSGAIEGTLERWRATLPPPSQLRSVRRLPSLMRMIGYNAVSMLLLLTPLLVYSRCFAGACASKGPASGTIRFDSIWDVSILLLFMIRLSWKTISKIVASSELRPYVQSFVRGLARVSQDVVGSQQAAPATPMGSPVSPTAGLSVRDVWAAHASKRAWAVRGASLDCRNGEVVAVLGDDGAGKSRLLTAIAEAIVNPSKGSLTTTKVRGSVSVGGLDVSKWDKAQLMRRVGLLLNDVRTSADNAVFMSGFTLEEVLEPMDGLLTRGSSTPTASARAVSQAMQVTGLSKSLLPRLPGKMSTAVTANENELTPSELRPRCHALSPSEWSKVLLARVLAQTIFDNDNVSNAPLVGSLLLLDDLTMSLSEVEELRIVQELRKTGAATVFSSHKWASGRLADRVVVVKEGSIVESGTHNELLARGPHVSIYAAQWQAMSTG